MLQDEKLAELKQALYIQDAEGSDFHDIAYSFGYNELNLEQNEWCLYFYNIDRMYIFSGEEEIEGRYVAKE